MTRTETHDWGRMEWLADAELGARSVSVARMILAPGAAGQRHRHDNCEEAILVLSGSVELELDAQRRQLSAGECVVAPVGVAHALSNVGDTEAELVLFYGSGARMYAAS